MKSYHIRCPKCNNNHSFYRYGKDSNGYQKYLCRNCHHQFAPERPRSEGANCRRKHSPCPVCGKAYFLHHDYEHYSNYRCTDKKCNHSFFVWKSAAIAAPSKSTLFGKHNFKRMRYPIQIISSALSMFYLGKNSFRNISLMLKTAFNIKASHTTVSNWCVKFAPLFVFFFNFVRPHSALNGLTPAQVAGLNLSKQRKREFLLVAWSFSMISWAIFSF